MKATAQMGEVVEFLNHWIADGHLQTFEDRDRFRKSAAALLDRLGQANASVGPTCPSFVCLTPKGCALYGCKMLPPPPERP